jgi:carbon-monoxide dehydrogenase iron sulfur subunit
MRSIFVDDAKCLSCKTCEIACCVAHSKTKTLFGAISEENLAQTRIYVEPTGTSGFPLQCRHCSDAQCVNACVTKAMSVDPQTGAVAYDAKRCLGCLMCVLACPFGVCEALKTHTQSPDVVNAISKCDLCAMEAEGPACVRSCPTGALSFGSPEEFSQNRRRAYLVNLGKAAGY